MNSRHNQGQLNRVSLCGIEVSEYNLISKSYRLAMAQIV